MRTASIFAAFAVPATVCGVAYLLTRRQAPGSKDSQDAERTARLFSAIDELTHAATDVIVASRPGVDAARIRRAMGQEIHRAVMELADLARGV